VASAREMPRHGRAHYAQTYETELHDW
jgi:hypothetical protein